MGNKKPRLSGDSPTWFFNIKETRSLYPRLILISHFSLYFLPSSHFWKTGLISSYAVKLGRFHAAPLLRTV